MLLPPRCPRDGRSPSPALPNRRVGAEPLELPPLVPGEGPQATEDEVLEGREPEGRLPEEFLELTPEGRRDPHVEDGLVFRALGVSGSVSCLFLCLHLVTSPSGRR